MSRAGTVTAVVITLNEERNIGPCLDALRWADETIVVDACSPDRTAEIAAGRGAVVVTLPWAGYGHARNAGAARATGEWIFAVDADERVSEALAAEVRAVAAGAPDGSGARDAGPPQPDVYEVSRRAYFLGRWIRHCGWYPGRVARLFRNGRARYDGARVHERLVFEGTPARLAHDLDHYTDDNLFHYFAKLNRYTSLAADDLRDRGRRASAADLLLKPPAQFLKMYLLRLGALDGMHGLALSLLSSAYVFVKYAKLREKSVSSPR
jgi:glycosyltransferase involved in cell wall biosynthesis